MSHADQLESMLRNTGSKTSWSSKSELSIETRISTVTFVFDGADRLVRVETPEDADTESEDETESEEDRPLRGHPQQHDEQGEEEQRRSEIPLEDHDAQRPDPRQGDGREIPQLEPGPEQLPFVHEVGREEQGQRDLGELAGLEVDRAEAGPVKLHSQPGA